MKKLFALLNALGIFLTTFVYVHAQEFPNLCKKDGYTISAINGVFTDEEGARNNERSLKLFLKEDYKGEKIYYHYLFNPSHGAGALDISDTLIQKFFAKQTDYDLIEMLADASEKITTQKVLLVAHSQGNFYANNFYQKVAGKDNGIPFQSIGVYGVASPASFVAGGGRYLTSNTDNVINSFRNFAGDILPANVSIKLDPNDKSFERGHSFSEVYIPTEGIRIVSDIQNSLDKLSANPERREDARCFEPQEINLAHKINGAVIGAVDTFTNGVVQTGKFTYVVVTIAGKTAYTFSESALVAVAMGAESLGGIIYDLAHRTPYTVGDFATSNTASVILSTVNNLPPAPVSKASNVPQLQQNVSSTTLPSSVLKTKTETSSEEATPPTTPRLVFIAGFGGGAPLISKPEEKLFEEVKEGGEVETLLAPTIYAEQCEQSLATDGCLLATTTLRFSWSSVDDALYYSLDKNGEYGTTTETTIEITSPDFLDYKLSVSATNSKSQTSATSTKTISVATIPIAINEIAWMGTSASSNDEWLELKNNTPYNIDLSQWALESKSGTPYIKLSGMIGPRKFILLERTNDETVSDITSSAIYTGALNNSGEQLILFHASTIFDSTPSGAWVAGENTGSTTRKTMERVSPKESGTLETNWKTWGSVIDFIKNSKDAEGNEIFGTPGARNSVNYFSLNDGKDIDDNLTLPADTGYYASTTILVSASSTLTIKEGVDISLYNGDLLVEGGLLVKGKEGIFVNFNTFSGTQTNNGIVFYDSVGTSTFDYVRVENTGGIEVGSSSVEIRDSAFINNKHGLELYDESVAVIENTSFASTTKEAVVAEGGSIVSIASSKITDTLDNEAVAVYDSYLTVSSTTIENVKDGDGVGAYNSSVSISDSIIKNIDDGDGLGLYDSYSSIKNTTLENGSGNGIAIYGGVANIEDSSISGFTDGAGIYVSDPLEPVVISNTEVFGNDSDVESYPNGSVVISP